jgi:hypothetical protein
MRMLHVFVPLDYVIGCCSSDEPKLAITAATASGAIPTPSTLAWMPQAAALQLDLDQARDIGSPRVSHA